MTCKARASWRRVEPKGVGPKGVCHGWSSGALPCAGCHPTRSLALYADQYHTTLTHHPQFLRLAVRTPVTHMAPRATRRANPHQTSTAPLCCIQQRASLSTTCCPQTRMPLRPLASQYCNHQQPPPAAAPCARWRPPACPPRWRSRGACRARTGTPGAAPAAQMWARRGAEKDVR